MKKIISLILAAAMLLSLGVVAFASENVLSGSSISRVNVTVHKYWYDYSKEMQHDPVTVEINAGGFKKTVVLSEENNWEATATIDTDIIPNDEKEYFMKLITVTELAVDGYKSIVRGPYNIFFGRYTTAYSSPAYEGNASFDIYNDELAKVEIPVTVTVKQTGNAAPEQHTFYYNLMTESGFNSRSDDMEASGKNDYKISYTGALVGDENGFSVTVDGKGTAKGTIVIEGGMQTLSEFSGKISKRAQIAPDGWTYDESQYLFTIGPIEDEMSKIGLAYDLMKPNSNAASGYEYLGQGVAAYVNEYKADRITTGSTTIKIPAAKEENPSTGAPVYGIVAAVIALGAAAVALKIRK